MNTQPSSAPAPDAPLILIMCTGNMCRSPMAEALMAHHLRARGVAAQVMSRGLAAPTGRAPHAHALYAAEQHGIPIAPDKRAAQVSSIDLRMATLVLVMDNAHRYDIQARYPQAGGKTFLLGHWDNGREIPDPLHEPQEEFLRQWPQIEAACLAWIDHLLASGLLTAGRA